MNRRRFAVVAGVVCVTACAVHVHAQGVVLNGDFITDATGWSPIGHTASGWYSTTGPNTNLTGGWDGIPGWFYVNNVPGSVPETNQLVSGLTPGQSYTISGYFARDTANHPDGSFRVLIDGSTYFQAGGSTGVWTRFSFNYVADDGDVLLRFQSQVMGDDSYGIDHISMTQDYSAAWTQVQTAQQPPARLYHSMTYDAARHQMVVFGGVGAGGARLGDTWVFDAATTSWTPMGSGCSESPSPREGPTMAFDPVRGLVVLFGGRDANGVLENDTWGWDGTCWHVLDPGTPASPPARVDAAMAWDGSQIVLFGGEGIAPRLGDTWLWNGNSWTQGPVGPPARAAHAMAGGGSTLILFGGNGSNGADFGDTWAWDAGGLAWGEPSIIGLSPCPRNDGNAMAFDAALGLVVLFGGGVGGVSGFFDDTWAFNLATGYWRYVSNSATPPARRYWHAMANDTDRQRIVLFGGYDGATAFDDTWELQVTTCTCLCSVDFNCDGFVDGIDYDWFMNAFEAGRSIADYNHDCFADGIDYDQFMNDFEAGCP